MTARTSRLALLLIGCGVAQALAGSDLLWDLAAPRFGDGPELATDALGASMLAFAAAPAAIAARETAKGRAALRAAALAGVAIVAALAATVLLALIEQDQILRIGSLKIAAAQASWIAVAVAAATAWRRFPSSGAPRRGSGLLVLAVLLFGVGCVWLLGALANARPDPLLWRQRLPVMLAIAAGLTVLGVAAERARGRLPRWVVWPGFVATAVAALAVAAAWIERPTTVSWTVAAVGPGARSVVLSLHDGRGCGGRGMGKVVRRTSEEIELRVTMRPPECSTDMVYRFPEPLRVRLDPPLRGERIVGDGGHGIARRYGRWPGRWPRMPNVVGLRREDALRLLNAGHDPYRPLRLDEVAGSRFVTAQSPAPGAPAGTKVSKRGYVTGRRPIVLTLGP